MLRRVGEKANPYETGRKILIRTNYLRICAAFGSAVAVAILLVVLSTSAQAILACEDPNGCPPSIIGTVPFDGETKVDRDRNIKAKFIVYSADSMMESSINVQTFRLYPGNLTREQLNPSCTSGCPPLPSPVSATVTYNSLTDRTTLNPEGRLRKKRVYTAVVEGAGDSDGLTVKDSDGRSLVRDVIWHFKTGRR